MRDVRFLVVDDSAMARKLIVSVIRTRIGSEKILQASDGKEAILRLNDSHVDMIISDMNMANLGGDELLAYVRREERFKHIPFLMVTVNNDRETILKTLQLGVTHYLVKPFTPADLVHKIRSSWNTVSKRRNERLSDFPEHKVTILADGRPLNAELVDLSMSGGLLRMKYNDAVCLFKRFELSLTFYDREHGQQWDIAPLSGRVVRIEAQGDNGVCLIALDFILESLPKPVAERFDSLLTWLGDRANGMIAE